MKLAVLSDIHDNVWNLGAALGFVRSKAEVLLVLGDLCAPFIIDLLAKGFTGEIHVVFGNNDGDRALITSKAAGYAPRVKLHGEFADLRFDGKRVAMNHYPQITAPIAASTLYDLVLYGHNHERRHLSSDEFDYLNPGAIMGFHGGRLENIPATFCTYDTVTRAVEWFEVKAGKCHAIDVTAEIQA